MTKRIVLTMPKHGKQAYWVMQLVERRKGPCTATYWTPAYMAMYLSRQ